MELHVVDMHTAGEPVRIVTGGYPELLGATILEKRREARELYDHLRRALMLEPRGHAGMYGVIPVKPSTPDTVIGALFTHNEGYSTMCGHATIALGRWLVESGSVTATAPETQFALELPCGTVRVTCRMEGGRVISTAFDSVPAFLSHRDVALAVDGLGTVCLDIAYGAHSTPSCPPPRSVSTSSTRPLPISSGQRAPSRTRFVPQCRSRIPRPRTSGFSTARY